MSKRSRRNRAVYPQAAAEAAVQEKKAPLWKRHQLAPLAGVLIAMAVYRFVAMAGDPGPTGSDAGNWLAFSQQLFGTRVKAADSMYFPVTLVLLKGLLIFLQPLVALKVLGVISSISIGVPFYFLVKRSCSSVMAASLTLCLLMAGYQLEMLAWGGYPQLLGTSFLLGSLMLLDEGMKTGNRRTLVWGGALTALVAGTHHFSLLVMAFVVALYVPATLWYRRSELKAQIRSFMTWAIASAGLSLFFAPWYVWYLRLLAGNGSLDANQGAFHGLGDVFSFIFSEAPLTWIALMALTPIICFAPFGKADSWRVRPLGLALILGSAALYAVTREVRIFQVLQVGVLLCLGVFAGKVEDQLAKVRTQAAPIIGGVGYMTYGVGLASLLLIFILNGNLRMEDAHSRYMSVNANAKDALDWVRKDTPANAHFLSSGGKAGWVNYAWWVEGYGQRRSYGTLLPEFLAFKQEKEQAYDANKIVAPDTSAEEARRLLDQDKIDYLFIYKPNGGDFQNLVAKVPVYISYQNDEFIVLRVNREAQQTSAVAKP